MTSVAAVFQIGSLGDSIMSIPALRAMRALRPECPDYVLVSRFDGDFYVRPDSVFDLVWKPWRNLVYRGRSAPQGRFRSIGKVFWRLRRDHPRYGLYLMPSLRSTAQVARDRWFFGAAGIRDLVGFRRLGDDEMAATCAPGVLHREAYLRLRRVLGARAEECFEKYSAPPLIHPEAQSVSRVRQWLDAAGWDGARPPIAVCPFANVPSREWPAAHTQALVDRLGELASVVIVGGKKDRARADSMVRESPVAWNACGVFSVAESAALFAQCRLAVTVDSGPMHLAAAAGTPVVTAFSRYDQFGRWLPLGGGHTILYRDILCAGCRAAVCPVDAHPCMAGISVDNVFSAVLEKLGLGNAAPPNNDTRVLKLRP